MEGVQGEVEDCTLEKEEQVELSDDVELE